ncbi:hypothetical protein EYR40_002178 [Pleurotus pulmonarius]|nr:hypothetical protein EYR36_002333 [Pleurotus pulmonarius]KAF4583687.1 hypothetical protein EYR40_002178 [Pleurotus pulmonarius]
MDDTDGSLRLFTSGLSSQVSDQTPAYRTDNLHDPQRSLSQLSRQSRSFGDLSFNQATPQSVDVFDSLPTQSGDGPFSSFNTVPARHSDTYMRLNTANSNLQKENMFLRGENKALRESNVALLAKIKSQGPLTPSNDPTSPMTDMIEIPRTPSPKRADMQLVQFWTWDEYTAAKNTRKGNTSDTSTQEKKGSKMLWFIETADGEPIKEERAKAMRRHCRAFWNGMKIVPKTWGRVDLKTHSEFSKVMSMNYPELTYCEGTWKLDQLASIDYPSWHSNHVVGRVKIEIQPNDTTLLKRSASPTTTLAKKQCISPSPVSSSSLSSSQRALIHLDNPLSNLFSETAPPIPPTARSVSPILLEYAPLPLQDPATDSNITTPSSNVNIPAPLPVNPAESTTPSIPNASTQPPTTFGASLSALRVTIPGIPYTGAMATLSQPAPGASAQTEGANPTNDLVKKSRKARRPPPHTTKPKSVIKSSWMDKHPEGTEKEFTQYWNTLGLEGQRAALLKATSSPEEKGIDHDTPL